MNTNIIKRQTPEEQELQKKCEELAALENELAQNELDLATQEAELNFFLTRYLGVVGVRYTELDEINAQIAEAEALLKPDERVAKDKAKEARSRAEESAKATQDVNQPEQPLKFKPSESIKKLYRDVAKKIHPDLCTNEKDRIRRQQLMAEANKAYEKGDEKRLQAILKEWEFSAESVTGEDVGAELVRVIRKIANIKDRIRHIVSAISELMQSDLYELKKKVEEAEEEGKDLLQDMANEINDKISEARERLRKTQLKKIRK